MLLVLGVANMAMVQKYGDVPPQLMSSHHMDGSASLKVV
jgi:hypothetical protein